MMLGVSKTFRFRSKVGTPVHCLGDVALQATHSFRLGVAPSNSVATLSLSTSFVRSTSFAPFLSRLRHFPFPFRFHFPVHVHVSFPVHFHFPFFPYTSSSPSTSWDAPCLCPCLCLCPCPCLCLAFASASPLRIMRPEILFSACGS